MVVQIDNYIVSSNGAYIKICVDGQNIIYEKLAGFETKANVAEQAIALIKDYNNRHDCRWGEVKKDG